MSKKTVQQRAITLNAIAHGLRPAGRKAPETYEIFDAIDGFHPWQTAVPEGFVPYQVRNLQRGQVVYFNFSLAREMGLISDSHPDVLTSALTKKILETFSIQIINEYDQASGFRPPKETIKPHPYMATRYLQLQHSNKQGKTSGDGRSVWNGVLYGKNKVWDISSRGTGVTCLSPGSVEAGQPLKTGEGEFGYGCGMADVTELVGSSVMSEIFHLNGISTERVLTVIDLGKGCGIGVRAAPNLIRPAHLFLYLKQGKRETLRQATDYLIQRQVANGEWKFKASAPNRYALMLQEVSTSFARFAARLERDYIFAWMDWDGDNILANAGIIDYGSIRQFGLRHDQYRYDDVQRFSTNLNEQRGKAREMVKVFAQLVTFLETGRRSKLEKFEKHAAVREFDRVFDQELRALFLRQVGFGAKQAERIMKDQRAAVEKLYSAFLVLEKTKTKAGLKTLPDGVNRPAVFNMRKALREMPELLRDSFEESSLKPQLAAKDLLSLMASSFAKKADLRLKGSLSQNLAAFIKAYVTLILSAADKGDVKGVLKALAANAAEANRPARITGNGAEFVVDAILKARKRGVAQKDLQTAMDLFIASQSPKSATSGRKTTPVSLDSQAGLLFRELVTICQDFEEDI